MTRVVTRHSGVGHGRSSGYALKMSFRIGLRRCCTLQKRLLLWREGDVADFGLKRRVVDAGEDCLGCEVGAGGSGDEVVWFGPRDGDGSFLNEAGQ
jgi:hypothetical protein